MSSNHFHHSSVWQVVVCKECRYAVWPSQVVGYLTNKQHKLARKQAEAEWEEIQGWAGVAQYPGEFAVPPFVDGPNLYDPQIPPGSYILRDFSSRNPRSRWGSCIPPGVLYPTSNLISHLGFCILPGVLSFITTSVIKGGLESRLGHSGPGYYEH
jgi:hypothetical protein